MEFFIERVRLNPCVWDMNHMSYRDTAKKDLVWERIAKECKIANGNEAKSQWKKIRDSHREAMRRRKTLNIKPWRYEAIMEFLLPQLENRSTTSNTSKNLQSSINDTLSSIDTIDNTDLDVAASSIPESSKKRQKNIDTGKCDALLRRDRGRDQRQCQRDEYRRRLIDVHRFPQDALKSLFDSFCQKTRELPRHLQLRVQREVFESITRAEEEAMTYVTFEPSNSFSPSSSSASYEYASVNPSNMSPNASPVPQTTPVYGHSPEVAAHQSIHIKEDVLTDSD